MTEPAPAPTGYASLGGLLIPEPLAVELIAAIREMYPDLTEGKDDHAAVRATLKYWLTITLMSAAESSVATELEDALENTRKTHEAKLNGRRELIRRAAAAIVEGAPGADSARMLG